MTTRQQHTVELLRNTLELEARESDLEQLAEFHEALDKEIGESIDAAEKARAEKAAKEKRDEKDK